MKLMITPKLRYLLSRLLIGLVLLSNLECAVVFLIHPEQFNNAYELSGIPGEAAIRGFAILFIMWNIPYVFALVQPVKNFLSLIEANLMQLAGLIGESWLITQIPLEHGLLQSSITRFIIFDGIGLILLFAAFCFIRPVKKQKITSPTQ
jgi:uncharacterized membrane protein YjfL (UPF0719 family)